MTALLASLTTIVALPTTAARAATGDAAVGAVSSSGANGYTQSTSRSDGAVTTTYAIGGTQLAQVANAATQTMPQRGSSAALFNPTGVNTATVAQLGMTANGCNNASANVQKDCGTTGSLTIAFSKPVTDPTLHVSGLGGYTTTPITNYSTYFQVSGATALGNSSASAAFDTGGPLTGTGLRLTGTGADARLQTSASKPGANCNDTTGAQYNGPAGCGSIQIRGTNLTSVTLGTGVLAYGAINTAGNGTVLDAFNLTTTIPASPPFALSLTKSNPASLTAGSPAAYSLSVTNAGPGAATGATVVDDLPPNFAYTDVAGAGWTCTASGAVAAGQTATCTFAGSIASGAKSTFTLTATPSPDAIATTVRNVAAVDPSGQSSPVDPGTCTATGSPAGCAYPATQTVNGSALTCTAGDLYALDSTDHNFYLTSPTDGTQTLAGTIGAASGLAINGMAVTNGSGIAYAISGTAATGNKPTIYRYDPTTNTTTPFTGPTLATTSATNGTFIAGALNPVNDVYYFGFVSGTSPNQVMEIYGFDTTTNTPISGRIARLAIPANNGTANGDIAFDRIGHMFFLATTGNNTSTANPLLVVNGIVGTTGADTAYATKVIANLTPNDSTFNGMAFDLPTGYLYVTGRDSSGNSFIKKINPSSGAQVASFALAKSATQVIDAASCNYNYSLTNQANILNRAGAGDQFTLSISGGGLVSPQTATTSGSDLGLQDDLASTAGPVVTLPGNTYTVSETASGTTTLANYTTTYVCTNLLTNAVITSGSGTTASFAFPSTTSHDGIPVGCVFTNSAYRLSLTKTNPTTLVAGQPATYTFAVKNSGKSAAPTATVVDRLPANVAYTSTAGTGWTCTASGTVPAGQTVTCSYSGSIAAGATNTALAITVTPTSSLARTAVQNKAAVDPDGGANPVDPTTCTATDNPAGCAVAASQTITSGVVLGLTKSAPSPALIVGYPSAYTLRLTNTGVNASAGATVADQLPANIAFTSASGATCTASGTVAAGQLLSCTVPSATGIAANGGTYSFTVSVTPQSAAVGQAAVNRAAVDPDGGTNPATPSTCTITGSPAGCAVAPSATPVADVVNGPSLSYTTTVGTPVASIDVKSATTSSQGKTIVNPTVATQPANGVASVNADGTLRYVPNAGFSGADSFTYRICDDGNPAACDTDTISITVTNVFTPGPAITTPQNQSFTSALATIATTSGAPLDPTRVTRVGGPAHGTISISASTGAVTYTPSTGYTGPDSYQVQVCDTSSPVQCTTITKSITVQANTVTANDDTATTNPATAVSINVRGNDVSTTGQPLAAPTIVTPPARGTAVVAADGTITYTPASGKTGTDTFRYEVCDTSNPTPVCSRANVTVTIPNTVTANNDAASTPQNTTVSIPLLANDTVSNGGSPLNPGSVVVTTSPSHGTATISSATGAATFVPTAGYTGTDSFGYKVCDTSDPTPVCKTATATITIGANTVTANPDTASTTPGAAVSTDVRANDTTATGQALAYPTVLTQPTKGSAAVDTATGRIVYTPTNGTSGVDSYTYRVCDTSTPTPVCSSTTVTVTVANTVTAVADSASTPQNTPVVLDVPANDTVSPNGAPLNKGSVTVSTAPAHGSTSVDTATGKVTFTPTTGYTGTDSFAYRICDTSSPTATCATATATVTVGANTVTANPDTDATTPGVAVTTNVRANDTTSTGQPLASPTVTTAPGKGTTTVNANGTITYTPTNGTSGVDTYRYQVCDTSNPTPVCSSTTVTITVANAVKANDDVTSTPQNTATTTTVLANDTVSANGAPLDPASVRTTTAPLHGTAVANADGTITYTPANGYTGTDSYGYRVCDKSTPTPTCSTATVTVTVGANTVTAGNDTASTTPGAFVDTNVRANDTTATGQPLAKPTVQTQPAKGTAVVNTDGSIRYTPANGTSGTDSYTYTVCDTSTPNPVCSQATVTVTVVNTVTAGNDTATTPQNTAVTTTVLANDTVSTGGAPLNPASVAVTTAPAHGSTSVDTTTGKITFTPTAGYTGTDVYSYQVCDTSTPTARCATANVTVTIGANTVTANPDAATTQPGTSVALDVRANDVSTTGQPLANPTIVTPPVKGTVTVGATSGRVVYTPAANTSGVFTFRYQVCDTSTPNAVCSQADVTVTVPNVVTAADDSGATSQNKPITTAVLGNDTVTANGAPLNAASVTVVTAAAHGTTSVNTTTGAITYTPANGYAGTDSYVYRVCDGSTPTPLCATATVSLSVGGNVVTAANDSASTTPRNPVVTDVRANDTTSTGQPISSTRVVTQAAHGTAAVNPDGTITYTPADGFTGTFTYRYEVCDNSSPTPFCGQADVAVTVANTVTPVADSATVAQNTTAIPSSVTTNVVTNDNVTAGGAPLNPASVTITSPPVHGVATANNNGTITYVPAVGYAGSDLLTYQVCDTSTPTPVCAKASLSETVTPNTVTATDDAATTTAGTAVNTDVRANDVSTTKQPLANPTVTTAPARGTTTVNADGTITYTPTNGTSGTDSYTYTVCDTSNPTPVCSSATVTVTVASSVTANPDSDSTAQNASVTTAVLGNDTVSANGAPLNPASVAVTTAPAHGTTSVNTMTGAVTYTPAAGYSGTDTYRYQVCDRSTPANCTSALVTITVRGNTVTAVADTATTAPVTAVDVDVRANDRSVSGQPLAPPTVTTAPAHGTATIVGGSIRYVPANNFSGTDVLTYQVCDTGTTPACDSTTLTITVPNTVTAVDDTATTPQNRAVTTAAIGNDTITAGGAPLAPASVTVIGAPAHGSTSVNTTTGAVTYTPANGYTGIDGYNYRVCDTSTPTPKCATATVTVTVGGNTVTASDDSATTNPATAVDVNVRVNDTSGTGQPLGNPVVTAAPGNGSTAVNATTGVVTYRPVAGFSGTDTFGYRVCDTSNPTPVCATATVTITVTNVVTAGNDTAVTPQNTSVATDVLANDSVSANGAPLDKTSVAVTTAAAHGTTSVDTTTGRITYTPATGYTGTDTYTYRVCDTSTPTPKCATATVRVTVGANTVTANPDSATTTAGNPVTTNVKANDTTATGQPLAALPSVTTAPTKGTATVNADGTITYQPTSSKGGVDTYRYTICDTSTPDAVCATTTVTVTVGNVVTAVADSVSTPQNTAVTVDELANDTVSGRGAPLDPGSVTITAVPTHGSVVVNASGTTTYTPAGGYTGTDSYNYRVCDTSTPTAVCASSTVTIAVGGNSVSANNDSTSTLPGTAVATDVRANDTSSTGQPFTNPTITTGPGKGTAAVNANGTITYTPANGTSGTDSLGYQVCDTSQPTPVCASATLTVAVNNLVTAVNDTSSTQQNTAVATDVLANDSVRTNGAPLDKAGVTVTTAPAHGTTSVATATGKITYTPASGYSGTDTYVYRVCDTSTPTPTCGTASVTITVGANTVTAADDTATTTPGNPVATNVRGNDTSTTGQPFALPVVTSNPAKGSVSVGSDGGITYTPTAGTSGTDSYGYRVCDTSNPTPVCATATVTVTVANTVRAADDTSATAQNAPVTITVLGNDTVSPNGAPLRPGSVTITTPVAHGSTSVDATTGAVTYTPDAGYSGPDAFGYRVCDTSTPTPVCASATATISVGTNTVGANDDTDVTKPGTPVATNVRANDTSGSGQPLGLPGVLTQPAHGTATAGTDGSITYSPANGFSGVDSYTYRICDTGTPAVCASATVTVTVDNTVTANPDSASVVQNGSVTVPVLANDTISLNGAPLRPASVTVTAAPTHGAAVVNPDGTIAYTPTKSYSGSDTLAYRVCDSSAPTNKCDTTTVTLTVRPNTVTANADSFSTPAGTAVTVDVRSNDVSATGQALAAPTIVVAPVNGSAVVNPDGTITYTPAAGKSGTDSFSYSICDTSTPTPVCAQATATATVSVVNTVTARDDAAGVRQNASVVTPVLDNDTVSAGGAALNPASVTVTTDPAHGSASVNTANGAITYTPAAGYSGSDTYRYQVCDRSTPNPVCASADVAVTVGGNTVIASDDTANTTPGNPVTTIVRANDSSTSGQALAAPTIATQPAKGTVSVGGDGSITYTPADGTSGTDTYRYQVCDTGTPAACSSATVTVTVTSTVTARNDTAATGQNASVSIPVLDNDNGSTRGAALNPASVSVTTAAGHGTTNVDTTTGAISYTPAAGFSGVDAFGYRVCDRSTPTPVCGTASVTVTVGANTVAAANDADSTVPGRSVITTVLANDTSGSGQPFAAPSITAAPTKGSVTVNADRTITYTPTAGTSGVDTYRYRVCDTGSPAVCGTATVTITVLDTVVAHDDAASVAQNGTVTTPVLGNDTSTSGGAGLDPTSVTVTTAPGNGTTTVTQTGSVVYKPNAGFSGTDTYRYRVCDASTPTPYCDTAAVTVTVGGNTVTAVDDTTSTLPGNSQTTDVRANDTSATGQPLANPTIVTQPTKGAAVVNANGTIRYTPTAGTSGVDTYKYRVCDTGLPAVCATATVTVTVPNTVTAVNDSASTGQNRSVTTPVLSNDQVAAGGAPLNPATVAVTTAPAHGVSSVDAATGAVTYTPANGYSGTDTYTYQVCDNSTPTRVCGSAVVTVTVGGNSVTASPDSAATTPGTAVTVDVRANDSSGSGQPLDAPTVVTQPGKGSATVDGTGKIVYTPANGTSGTDTFTYRVCDTGTTPVCDTATVTVTVTNVVNAVGDPTSTAQNKPVTTNVIANDRISSNGAPLAPGSVSIVTGANHGTTTVNGTSGAVTYTPASGYTGTDSYTYSVCDTSTPTPVCDQAVVTVTVGANAVTAGDDTDSTTPGTPVRTAVLGNDTSASGQPFANPTIATAPARGTATVNADGTITYTPTTGTAGVDTYRYRVCDTGSPAACATATVTISVPNKVTAVDDTATVAQNGTVVTSVLGNDKVTANGAPLNPASVAITTPAAHGATSVNTTTGAVTYTPTAGYSGADSYTYQVCDTSVPTPVCGAATVSVSVAANTVTARNDTATTTPGVTVTTPVTSNDSSASGQPLGAPTVASPPAKGTVAVTGNSIAYTPNPSTSGTDTYTYQVCDTGSSAACATATVTVTVINTVTAGDDSATVAQNGSVTTPVLGNDRVSPNGAPLNPASVSVTNAPGHGTTSVDPATGAVTYVPARGYSGADSYTYRVCDGSTPTPVCANATVTITVGGNTVAVNADTATTTPATPVTTDVRANDSSSSGQSFAAPVIVTAPGKGTATVNADGTITYTPTRGTAGTDTYGYRVCDTGVPSVCGTAMVTVSVVDTVIVTGDSASTAQNANVTTAVLGNDQVSPGGPALVPGSVTVTTAPMHGATSVNASNGAITYTPNAGYSGADSYVYRVCDGSTPTPVCGSATVAVSVGQNTVAANDDAATTRPATAVTIDVRDNDTSSTGQPFAAPTVATAPAKGSVTGDGQGNLVYTPANGTSGTDTFTYQVCDTGTPAACATATVTVTVTNTVTATADSATTPQNRPVTTTVLGNDTVTARGAPLDPSSVSVTSPPLHGTVAPNAQGEITYTPASGYSGTDRYTYQVCDTSTPTPFCASATVSVTVGTNTVTAKDDTATTTPGTPVTTTVTGNDTSSSGQALGTPTVATQPAKGTAKVNGDGTITYTPNPGTSGTDSYTYRVCDTGTPAVCGTATVTVAATNTVTAVADSTSVAQNGSVTTPVLGNDTVSPSGSALDPGTVAITTPAAHGTTTVDTASGAVTYTPAVGYSGTDTYTYRVCDSSTPTRVCGTATVTVQVGGNTVVANPDSVSTVPGNPVTTNVTANDSSTSGQPLSAPTIVTPPTKGTVTVNPDGTVTYTPNPNTSGTDGFNYQVCDTGSPRACSTASATVTITVANQVRAADDAAATAQNQPVTTTVLANDSVSTGGSPLNPSSVAVITAPAHGTTGVRADGSITYTPANGYSGTDRYTYKVCDGSTPTPVCDTATVTVTVGLDTVAAGDDSIATVPGSPVSLDVRGNDSSGSGQPLGVPTIVTNPGKGSVAVNPDGTLTYAPADGTAGTDSFVYRICDTSTPTPVCDNATVTVTVTDTVTATRDSAVTKQNTPVTTPVLANDTTSPKGPSLDPRSVTVTAAPTHGSTTVNTTTGAITYTPNAGFSGPDSYRYSVCDTSTPTPVCAETTVGVTVAANTVTAGNDTASTTPSTSVTTPVLANDSSSSGQPLGTPAVVSPPAHGTVVVNPDGTITYTPATGFSGSDGYTYQVCDTGTPAVCAQASVAVTVPNTVTANPDTAATLVGTAKTIAVLDNDTTSAGGAPLDPASVTVTLPPAHGSTTVDPATGVVTYVPANGYRGPDSFTYRVCDTSTPTPICTTAPVTISVTTDPVKATNDSATTDPGRPVTVPVEGNDASATGRPLAPPVVASQPAKGTAKVDGRGIVYTPNPGTSGTDTFTYTVCDTSPTPVCDTATVTVIVAGVVTAKDDTAKTAQNAAVTVPVLDNDGSTGAPLDPTSVQVTSAPKHGTTSVDAKGVITYTPTADYSGTDSFDYTVCDGSTPTPVCTTATVTVTVAPNVVTAKHDTATTSQSSAVVTPVLGNDSVRPGGAPLDPSSVTVTIKPAHGTTIVDPTTGAITYTPASGFAGTDTYTYRVCDTSTPTPVCATTTVTVTVAATPKGGLRIVKTGTAVGLPRLGSLVSWTITVINTGTAPMSSIAVSDPTGGAVTCSATTLAAGASTTCSVVDHVITAADVAARQARNTAQATGTDARGNTITSNEATAAVDLGAATPPAGGSGNGNGGDHGGRSNGGGPVPGGSGGAGAQNAGTASTGVPVAAYLLAALLALLAGAVLVLAGQRRRKPGRSRS